MTNRQYIAQLSDRELAELIGPRSCPPDVEAKVSGTLAKCPYSGMTSCRACWMRWLRKEHKE